MNESLTAASGQFEQLLLAQMLKSASFATAPGAGHDDDDDAVDGFGTSDDSSGFEQLMTQAIASAVERAGGIGLRDHIAVALAGRPSW